MNCPSCQSPLPPAARFCGVCGHQIPAPASPSRPVPTAAASRPGLPRAATPTPPPGLIGGGVSTPSPQFQGSRPVMGKPPPGSAYGKPRAREVDPFLGQVLNNRFKIDSKLGEGGFGAVYKGLQVATGRKVALKLLHPEMTRDENLVARFRREGLVLCNLQDPHTITTYDFDQTPDGTLYIAMELLEGKSLHQIFHSEAPIEWRRVLKIATQMSSSLGEAHKQGIVHRDLKPENIYLENRGGDPEFVKILDFGIAKVMRGENTVDPQAPQLTATGQTLGTLEYMSPEQLMGKQLDGRSDVYAIGVLCYELLTSRLPFPDAKGPAALITAQLKQTPMPPSGANPGGAIPAGVDRIVLKMLEKNKDHRFADVTALAHAAQACIAAGGAWGVDAPPAAAAAPAAASGKPRNNPALVETRRGDGGHHGAPPAMPGAAPADRLSQPNPAGPPGAYPRGPHGHQPHAPVPQAIPTGMPHHASPPPGMSMPGYGAPRGRRTLVWIVVGVLAVAAVAGTVLGLAL